MNNELEKTCTAFEGESLIATGPLPHVAEMVKRVLERGERAPVLIFDDLTSQLVEIDFRGSWQDVASRLARAIEPPRGPGRPKLGVVAREVTLLPRHWEWLSGQPGGASVALRKLVEEARRTSAEKDRVRQAKEVTYRFMSAIAGNAPGFEEASRALFAGDGERFDMLVQGWPEGIRSHCRRLAAPAFPEETMEAKADRRKAIQDYKSRKVPRGIFCARVGTTGPAWVGSSPNLDATRNGLWFELQLGKHRNNQLQEEWNRAGENGFCFEILEQLDDEICALSLNDLLKERRLHWQARLNARPV